MKPHFKKWSKILNDAILKDIKNVSKPTKGEIVILHKKKGNLIILPTSGHFNEVN